MGKSKSSSSPSKVIKAGKTSAKGGGKKSIEDVKDIVFKMLCENHGVGIKEVQKMALASEAGYGNPRSEMFLKAIKSLTQDDGLITKGGSKDTFALTEKGVKNIPEDMKVDPNAPRDHTKLHNSYIKMIEKKAKGGKDKIPQVWDILKDREVHSIPDIAKELGYSNPRSFVNTKILAAMKEMELIENAGGKGIIQMTNKAFPGEVS